MFNYLFPIFACRLVINRVVFFGLQRASDWAKELATERSKAKGKFNPLAAISPELISATVHQPTTARRL